MALFSGSPDTRMGGGFSMPIAPNKVSVAPGKGAQLSIQQPQAQTYTVGPTAVRAPGGIFDPAYNQALAGYGASAAGLAPQRGSNLLSFNPTSSNPFAGIGQQVGAGSAPLTGLPNTWLQNPAFQAPAYSTPPAAPATSAAPAKAQPNPLGNISDWLKQWQLSGFGGGGRLF